MKKTIMLVWLLIICSFASADILIYPQNATYYTDPLYNGSIVLNNTNMTGSFLNNTGWSLQSTTDAQKTWYNSDDIYGYYDINFAYRVNKTYDHSSLIDINNQQDGLYAGYFFNDGTKVNGVTCPDGCDFDGKLDYIQIADIEYPHIGVMAWVKVQTNPDRNTVLGKRAGAINAYTLTVETNEKPKAIFATAGGQNPLEFSTALPLDSWAMISYSFNGSYVMVCVNDTCESTAAVNPGTIAASADVMVIGTRTAGSNDDMLNGSLKNVLIYNRSITIDEIEAQYNAGIDGFAQNGQDLVIYYPMNDINMDSSTVYDTNHLKTGRHSTLGINMQGRTQYINLTNNSIYNAVELTTCAWVYPNEWNYMLFSKQVADGFEFFVDNNGYMDCVVSDGAGSALACDRDTYAIPLNAWSHLCAVVNTTNDKVSFYFNGSLRKTQTLSGIAPINNNKPLCIGDRCGGTYVNLNGTLDNIGIWDKALTATQIAEIHNNYQFNPYDFSERSVSYYNANVNETDGYDKSQFWFYLNTSINITIYNEELNLINNVTLDFISDDYINNYSTNTGNLFLPDILPGNYEITYTSDGYVTRQTYITLNPSETHDITLYLINDSATQIIADLYDNYGNKITGYYIKTYRRINGHYYHVETSLTNYNGETDFYALLNTPMYYWQIYDSKGTLFKQTTETEIYGTTLDFNIVLSAPLGHIFSKIGNYIYSLSYDNTTNKWTYIFTDGSGSSTYNKLAVYKLSDNSLVSQNGTTGQTGVLTVDMTGLYENGSTYIAKITANASPEFAIDTETWTYFNTPYQLGLYGVFMSLIIILLITFVGLWSVPVMFILQAFAIILTWALKLHQFSLTSVSVIAALLLLFSYIVSDRT